MPEPSRVEMWAMTHPIRFRIFELLREGPATASQLGRVLGSRTPIFGRTVKHVLERAPCRVFVIAPPAAVRAREAA